MKPRWFQRRRDDDSKANDASTAEAAAGEPPSLTMVPNVSSKRQDLVTRIKLLSPTAPD